jgi:hypothetical protein
MQVGPGLGARYGAGNAGCGHWAGDTAQPQPSGEVKELRRGVSALKEVVAELTLENGIRPSASCLRQIDPLSRPKRRALSGLHIGRYSPQPQSRIDRIDAQRSLASRNSFDQR